MQNLPQATGPQQSLTMALGTAIGVAITLGIVTQLPLAHLPTLKDFLSSLSAITVSLYAVVVTGRFCGKGSIQRAPYPAA